MVAYTREQQIVLKAIYKYGKYTDGSEEPQISIEELYNSLKGKGISANKIEDIIIELLTEGTLFEPRPSVVKTLFVDKVNLGLDPEYNKELAYKLKEKEEKPKGKMLFSIKINNADELLRAFEVIKNLKDEANLTVNNRGLHVEFMNNDAIVYAIVDILISNKMQKEEIVRFSMSKFYEILQRIGKNSATIQAISENSRKQLIIYINENNIKRTFTMPLFDLEDDKKFTGDAHKQINAELDDYAVINTKSFYEYLKQYRKAEKIIIKAIDGKLTLSTVAGRWNDDQVIQTKSENIIHGKNFRVSLSPLHLRKIFTTRMIRKYPEVKMYSATDYPAKFVFGTEFIFYIAPRVSEDDETVPVRKDIPEKMAIKEVKETASTVIVPKKQTIQMIKKQITAPKPIHVKRHKRIISRKRKPRAPPARRRARTPEEDAWNSMER